MGEFWEKITGSIGTGNGAGGSGPPKWFRRDNLLILVLLGVLLFIIALPVKRRSHRQLPLAQRLQNSTMPEFSLLLRRQPGNRRRW